ncbi:MAG TPA: site-specific integrase [Bacteroidales bacterium]|nr:site-specific integrase [Bacteroidales bacterium]
MQATAKIYFQKTKSKRTKDNLVPVKLEIIHNRVQKYYSISKIIKDTDWLFLSDDDIEKVTGDSPRGKYRDIAFEYKRITDYAGQIISSINTFSFNQFDEKFTNKITDWDSVFVAMVDHIKALKINEKFGYASSFESTLRAIKEYHEGKELDFNCRQKVETRYTDYASGKSLNFVDITPTWLKAFESWLKKKGKSQSTIGIYVRNIRVLFNKAMKEHKIRAEYPFTVHKPKTAKGRKTALTAIQISMIASYKTNHPQEQFYRDIFMFSFLGNGINLSDIARLRYSNIVDHEIEFARKKTEDKEANEDKLHVPITKTMQLIIDRHGIKAIGDSYIFPILRPDWSEERNYAEIKQLTKQVNKYVRRIALIVGINENISSYVARHSWATIAKNSGTSTEFISEALGHSSVIVTKRYLKSFEKSTREEHSGKMEDAIYNQKAV